MENIFSATWNVDNKIPNQEEILKLFDIGINHNIVDLYVFGLQEVLQFNTKEVDIDKIPDGPPNIGEAWENLFRTAINSLRNKGNPVVTLKFFFFKAIILAVFIPQRKRNLIMDIELGEWVTRTNTLSGIKGACAISFRFKPTQETYCFVNCHLQNDIEAEMNLTRIKELDSFIAPSDDTRGFRKKQNLNILNHCHAILVGDLNFRIELSLEETKTFINESKWDPLIAKDQLIEAQRRGKALKGFKEGYLEFPPTYKFDPNTDIYDTSDKARVPAWCDRVLVRGDYSFHYYKSVPQLRHSDHKPVVAFLKKHSYLYK